MAGLDDVNKKPPCPMHVTWRSTTNNPVTLNPSKQSLLTFYHVYVLTTIFAACTAFFYQTLT